VKIFLSEEHANIYMGSVEGIEISSLMGTEAADLVRYLMNDGVIESREEGLT